MTDQSSKTVLDVVIEQSRRVLETYRIDPRSVEEHANGERRISQGGYGDRQVFELVQNGADEIREDPGGEVAVVLTATYLYCANEGGPVTPDGADTILRMSVSRKRGGQIGRFGVGVKSVLSICDAPQFFTKENGQVIGFGFDKDWSAAQIKGIAPEAQDTPVLRMAQPLDPERCSAADPVLRELLDWATTVVRLPLKSESVTRLGMDIASFPVEFPLFSNHVGIVTLEDRRSGQVVRRQIFQHSEGHHRVIQEVRPNGESLDHRWRVFSRLHRPSLEALAAAGELHDRPEIEISWAVPDRARERGNFWAYFPTKFATTLRGILNAPWKTSEDRQAIFDGNEFNDELLEVSAELVVDSLPEISGREDPAVYIDYLPGRGREAPQFADERLTKAIWRVAAQRPSLPDQDGMLRPPSEVSQHPEGLLHDWLNLWGGYQGRPVDWVHHSVERRERRARVNLILREAERPEAASVQEWLEALVADGRPEASAVALCIAAEMHRANHSLAEQAARARILLTESDGMVAPLRGKVFRRSSDDDLADKIMYVHLAVLDDPAAVRALEVLGIQEADAPGRFTAIVDQGFHSYNAGQWSDFWALARQVGPDHVVEILTERVSDLMRTLKVRTLGGDFRILYDCLIPGPVVPADGSRDRHTALDTTFHAPDLPVLKRIGLIDKAVRTLDPTQDSWFEEYRDWAHKQYLDLHPELRSTPKLATMQLSGADPVGPLHFLVRLSDEGRSAFLRNLPDIGRVQCWTIQHGARTSTRTSIDSPFIWIVQKYGQVRTSRGLRTVRDSVGPGLHEHRDVLPVADLSDSLASDLRFPAALDEVPEGLWADLLSEATDSTDDVFVGRAYALFLKSGYDWPHGVTVRCRIGDEWGSLPDSEIAVAASRDEYNALIRENIPALLAPTAEDAERMIEEWGMLTVSAVIEKEIQYVAQDEPVPLTEEFPHLKVGHSRQVNGWSLLRCTELEEVIRTPNGMRTATIQSTTKNQIVLVLRPDNDAAALAAVDRQLKLGLGPGGVRSLMKRRERQQEDDRLQAIRKTKDEDEKILQLVGEEELRRGLPEGLVESHAAETGASPSGKDLARLARHAHGDGLIRHHRKDIAKRFLDTPDKFAGTSKSRRFITELGLPESYAGARTINPPAEEDVDGPSGFPRLHEYQERLAEKLLRLLREQPPGRAMLHLPTGAGKTRVAAEGLIRHVKENGISGPILWIAQSEELCEQAVQSWKFVWSKVGPGQRLTVSRLWGTNSASAVSGNPHLVVATDAKLEQRLSDEEYAWLRRAAVVIVDEAHHAIAPRYTGILKQLGITQSGAGQTDRPLIGLSATPFRGRKEETERLVNRFGGRRLDDGVFGEEESHVVLQRLEVLAHIEHRQLSGATIDLTDEELKKMAEFGRGTLPETAEEKLALDDARNQRLLDTISGLPDGWPILLFATSVNHGKLIAARLNGRGISAASIDAFTPMAERRNTIDRFRRRELRVITNYSVLAQGFDAPATRAVIVARPTYSPNVYQQMIGRGMRGPKNGGEESCLILDVKDNIQNFRGAIVYADMEDLWGMK